MKSVTSKSLNWKSQHKLESTAAERTAFEACTLEDGLRRRPPSFAGVIAPSLRSVHQMECAMCHGITDYLCWIYFNEFPFFSLFQESKPQVFKHYENNQIWETLYPQQRGKVTSPVTLSFEQQVNADRSKWQLITNYILVVAEQASRLE